MQGESDMSRREMLRDAGTHLQSALDLLDGAGAPAQIGAHIDLAIHRLGDAIDSCFAKPMLSEWEKYGDSRGGQRSSASGDIAESSVLWQPTNVRGPAEGRGPEPRLLPAVKSGESKAGEIFGAMPNWRMKLMPVSEWGRFQQLFGEFQLLYCRGDPDLALFAKQRPRSTQDEIYITGPKLDVIERLSPGGWEDAKPPAGDGLILLVGTAESWAHLGISRHSAS